MLRSRKKKDAKKKGKKVNYELIDRETVVGRSMYMRVRDLVADFHDHLNDARIALAWCTSWTPDVDGRLVLGKLRKASDLEREFHEFDFVVLLNKLFWNDEKVTDAQRVALLDHELCHASRAHDQRSGAPLCDERGRAVWRTRKHDIEEFSDIIHRHGVYKRDLEIFAGEIIKRARVEPHQPCDDCVESPGWAAVVIDGIARTRRCACYLAWSERRAAAMAVNDVQAVQA